MKLDQARQDKAVKEILERLTALFPGAVWKIGQSRYSLRESALCTDISSKGVHVAVNGHGAFMVVSIDKKSNGMTKSELTKHLRNDIDSNVKIAPFMFYRLRQSGGVD